MKISKAMVMILALTLLLLSATSVNAASSKTQENVYKAQASFMKDFKIKKGHVATPLLYDINNDGKDEVILSTAMNDMIDSDLFIGVYSLANGNRITAKKYPYTSHIPIEIRRIKNKTFKNSLAIISHGTTGFGAFGMEIITLKNNVIFKVSEFEVEGGGEKTIVVDMDNDGFHEFVGLEVESGLGADRLPFRGGATRSHSNGMTEKRNISSMGLMERMTSRESL